ncbi:MBL fold metallo-hydrolase [Candidatus Mycalebacterium sp.]
MKVTVLGCATSTGVPVPGCDCGVCSCAAEENLRTRSSALVETADLSLLIDTSPDLRTQALRANISAISAVLYTHSHADHTNGIDDLKPFTDFGRKIIDCYANPETAANLRRNFGYIFGDESPGEVKPNLRLNEIDGDFSIGQMRIIPVKIDHGSWKILGYRIGNFAYLTDCNGIPPESMKKLAGLELLVISALRYSPHPSHFNLEQTLEHIEIISPKKAVLTHMSCKMGYFELKKNLPANVEPARDGAIFEIQNTGGKTGV